MIRTLCRHLGESLKSLKRNAWLSIASISAVTITLIGVGIFLSVMLNVTKLAKDVESTVDVSVFVEIGTTKNELKKLETELKELDDVKSVTFSGKDEQYDRLVTTMGDSWNLFSREDNPLHDVFIVSPTTPELSKKIQEDISDFDNVFKADYGGLSSDKIMMISRGVQKWGVIASVILLVVAIFLISNTVRTSIRMRKPEIQIMRLVGAKNSFIRWPFFFEGTWIGILGAIIPMILMSVVYPKVYVLLNSELFNAGYTLLAPNSLILKINLGMLALGIVIGSIGSMFSMGRFLKI